VWTGPSQPNSEEGNPIGADLQPPPPPQHTTDDTTASMTVLVVDNYATNPPVDTEQAFGAPRFHRRWGWWSSPRPRRQRSEVT
jgi:hypothetical protein